MNVLLEMFGLVGLMFGSAHLSWVLVKHWPLKTPKPLIDYAAINAAERTLGFVQSDYRAFGVEPVDVVADTDKLIAEIDYQLLPEDERKKRDLEKKIAAFMRPAKTIQPMDEPYAIKVKNKNNVVQTLANNAIALGDGWIMDVVDWGLAPPSTGYDMTYYDMTYYDMTYTVMGTLREELRPRYAKPLVPSSSYVMNGLRYFANQYGYVVDSVHLHPPRLGGECWHYEGRVRNVNARYQPSFDY